MTRAVGAQARKEAGDVVAGDIGGELLRQLRGHGTVAWDIETSGLDWTVDRIGTVQLFTEAVGPVIVQPHGARPDNLLALLADPDVTKVFHHAPFDLRFMVARWNARPARIQCTKIAAKVLFPGMEPRDYSLGPTLARLLDITISKDEQRSDWLRSQLSPSQLRYAAADVQWLIPLMREMRVVASNLGRERLLDDCFAHIPTRVDLEVGAFGDVFAY